MKKSSGMQMIWLVGVAAFFCLTSMAADVPQEQVDKACAADVEKLCKGVQPGEGRIARCMKEHEQELSPACKENIGKMKETAREAVDACKGDTAKFCKDVEPGKGRIARCLKQHEAELSAACKEQMKPRRPGK